MSDRDILKRRQSVLVEASVYESNDEQCLLEFDFMGQPFSGRVCRTKVHIKSEQDKVKRIRDYAQRGIDLSHLLKDESEMIKNSLTAIIEFIDQLDSNEGES